MNGASDYSFYTIIPDGWYFGSDTDDKKVPYIVDTGTTLIYLPTGKSSYYPPPPPAFVFYFYYSLLSSHSPTQFLHGMQQSPPN